MIKFGEISPLWLSFFAIFYGLFTTWQKFAKTFGGKISVVVVVNKWTNVENNIRPSGRTGRQATYFSGIRADPFFIGTETQLFLLSFSDLDG